MSAVAAAAKIHANGLAAPTSPEITDGSPNTPLPMMQLIVSAARLQRPIARTSVGWLGSGIAGLYHRMRMPRAVPAASRAESLRMIGPVIQITPARYRHHLVFRPGRVA